MCKIKTDRRKEGMCWLLAAIWKIEAKKLEEEIRKWKSEFSTKD